MRQIYIDLDIGVSDVWGYGGRSECLSTLDFKKSVVSAMTVDSTELPTKKIDMARKSFPAHNFPAKFIIRLDLCQV